MIAKLGAAGIAFLQGLSSLVWMARETASEVHERMVAGKSPCRWEDFVFQTNRVGVGSVPLVSMVAVFFGLTMALLTGYQLETFGMVSLVPAVVSVSFTREMGPLLAGIVLAARIGAAFTAELGAMTASEEVEAIEGMGIGPLRYLVIPRFTSILLLAPCLAIVAVVAGIVGAAFISQVTLHLNYGFFYDQVVANLLVKDVISGVVKSVLFGGIIGWIACFKGLAVRGGAVGVGTATTSSVVSTITTVIICDSVCNILLVTILK